MFKFLAMVGILVATFFLAGQKVHAATDTALPSLVDVKTEQVITFGQMAKQVAKDDVVIFGEFHDSQPVHDAELAVLKDLHAIHGDKLVFSMEMFERDVQSSVNDFLNGKLTEEQFMAVSRPWPQYVTAYRPLIMYAKEHHIPVLAGNIPRYIASAYAKAGSLDAISATDKVFLPKVHIAGSKAYQAKFFETMNAMSHGGMNIPKDRQQQMFMAQCLKDDTMVESILQYKQEHSDAVIFHIQGAFHSESRLGVVEKLQWLNPDLKISVINTISYNPGKESLAMTVDSHKTTGDYLVLNTKSKE